MLFIINNLLSLHSILLMIERRKVFFAHRRTLSEETGTKGRYVLPSLAILNPEEGRKILGNVGFETTLKELLISRLPSSKS